MQPILLVHPVVREWAKPANLPLGVAYTAAALKRAGVPYELLDDNMLRWSDARIVKFFTSKPVCYYKMVGISAMCSQYRQVKRWVRLIRQESHRPLPIIVGGPISVLGERLCGWLGVWVWQGESEELFPRAVSDGVIPPVTVAPAIGDLDTLPHPSWGDFNIVEYANTPVGAVNKNKWVEGTPIPPGTPRSMNLLAARGCPFRCRFCAHDFLGKRVKFRSVESVIAEMEELYDRYTVRYFHTSDDNTTANPSWLRRFCEAFSRHPKLKDCTWGCAGRTDIANFTTLQMMHLAGCRIVGFGVESGSQRMLDAMDKRTTVEENERAVLAAREVFGAANYSMMVGFPGEDDQSIQESIDFCRRTETRPEAVFYATPIPGSWLYDHALKQGLIRNEEAYLLSLGENSKQIACNASGRTDEWLMAAKKKIEDETRGFGGQI